jgi:hypothetical protein
VAEAKGEDVNEPRPCSAAEAVQRAQSLLVRMRSGATDGATYQLGTGDYRPTVVAGTLIDRPWTHRGQDFGSDCAGFAISWCYRLQRHRDGYNHGPWATVSDDLNCNSAIEDSEHALELFAPAVGIPLPGDLVTYPTIRLPGHPQVWIGHVAIVLAVRATAWDPTSPRYDLLDVAQCCGPDGRSPPVLATDASHWIAHDRTWPKPEHRTRVIRAQT